MRRLIVLLAVLLVAGCAGRDPVETPRFTTVVSAGFETVRDGDAMAEVAARAAEAGADTVAVSAGRADWTTFRWAGHEDVWAAGVAEDDDFARAAATVRDSGAVRVVAVVDVFAPGYLAEHPELASRDVDGDPIDFQVSVTELTEGEHGRRLVEMAGALAAHDDVDAVNLTELHYDVGGFGEDDEELFRRDTGQDGWPRTDDGEIDADATVVGEWRAQRITGFVEQVADAVHAHDAELLVDVRAGHSTGDPDDPRGTRAYGQDYPALLQHADRLVIWHYIGLQHADGSGDDADRLAADLSGLDPRLFVLSIGLWADDDETLPPDALADELADLDPTSWPAVWITPASLADDEHWQALAEQWG